MLTHYQSHESLPPFQLRNLRRFPNVTEFIPEIARFEPLAEHDKGVKTGHIHLVNGTVLDDVDEVGTYK